MTALEGKALLDHGKAIAKRYAGRVGPDVAEELGAETPYAPKTMPAHPSMRPQVFPNRAVKA